MKPPLNLHWGIFFFSLRYNIFTPAITCSDNSWGREWSSGPRTSCRYKNLDAICNLSSPSIYLKFTGLLKSCQIFVQSLIVVVTKPGNRAARCSVSLEFWLLACSEVKRQFSVSLVSLILPTSLSSVVITFLRLHCWHISLASCTLLSRIWKQIIVVVRVAGVAGPLCVLPAVCYLFINPRETEL